MMHVAYFVKCYLFTCVRSKRIIGSPLMLFYDGLDICWRRPIQWPPRWADSSAVQTLLEEETCKSRLSWHSMQHSQTAVTTENSQCITQTSFPEKEGQLNNLFFQWLDRICVVFPTWWGVGDRQAEQVDAVTAGPQGSGTRGVSAPPSGLVLVALPLHSQWWARVPGRCNRDKGQKGCAEAARFCVCELWFLIHLDLGKSCRK